MLMRLTSGDEIPLTLGRKVVRRSILDIKPIPFQGVRWIEHEAAGAADRAHPSSPDAYEAGIALLISALTDGLKADARAVEAAMLRGFCE